MKPLAVSYQVTMKYELGLDRPTKAYGWCTLGMVLLGSGVSWKWYIWNQV